MNRRGRGSAGEGRRGGGPHRFLKPGALARLRDSRISARSPRPRPAPRLSSPPSSPPQPPASPQIDGSPCFSPSLHGPRFPQRKKLAAPKLVLFCPAGTDGPDPLAESLGFDLVAAH